MELLIEDKAVSSEDGIAVGYDHCRECRRSLKKWEDRMIGLCRRCYRIKFPPREITLPPLRRKVNGIWIKMFSYSELHGN